MKSGGAKVWYFADGWLPEKTKGSILEALMILNPGSTRANIVLDTTQSNLAYYINVGWCANE